MGEQKIQLPYTLQTTVGMVLHNGLPGRRHHYQSKLPRSPEGLPIQSKVLLPRINRTNSHLREGNGFTIHDFQDFARHDWCSPEHKPITDGAIASILATCPLASECVYGVDAEDVKRYFANIDACRSEEMDAERLKALMEARTRLDLEQAAAAVVSTFVNADRMADAEILLRELTGVLAVSAMNIDPGQTLPTKNTIAHGANKAFANYAKRVSSWSQRATNRGAGAAGEVAPPKDYTALVELLLRVRRSAEGPPRRNRCIYIPAWVFRKAGIEPPSHHAEFLKQVKQENYNNLPGSAFPEKELEEDSIRVSHHRFNLIQRGILRLFPFWRAEVRLRRDIHNLEEEVLFSTESIDKRLREAANVAEVAFWFFKYQRRLQLKVVSDDKWTTFLAKGETSKVYQNNVEMKSTFEEALQKIAGKMDDERVSSGSDSDTIALIDRCCLLMKTYVGVYGQGKKKNLTFQKGVSGGSGRGPVDEYNLLCDVLAGLKLRAKSEGITHVPGPVYKFLAKDIMSWNNAWGDDAFANDKKHGWEDWLDEKEKDGKNDEVLGAVADSLSTIQLTEG